MSSPLSRALRQAAADVLPAEAFLRWDRGDALFVTDAPRRRPDVDWAKALRGAGFECQMRGGLLALTPGAAWLARLEAARPEPPDALCADLRRFRGLPVEPESLRLFAFGARCLEAHEGADAYDKMLRRRAAECLRLNAMNPNEPQRGGGLYACALLNHEMEDETDEDPMAGTFLF